MNPVFTHPTTSKLGIGAAALLGACLAGCQSVTPANSAEPSLERQSDATPKAIPAKKLAKPTPSDSIPDAADIGLAPSGA